MPPTNFGIITLIVEACRTVSVKSDGCRPIFFLAAATNKNSRRPMPRELSVRFRGLWRRRESNPRPNKEPEGFLHVYSAIDPLARDGRRRPDPCRSLFNFARRPRLPSHYPLIDDTPYERLPRAGPPFGILVIRSPWIR